MSPHSENNNTMKHKATFCDQLKHNTKQELSYRQQIARQLRTQYTLKASIGINIKP